MKLLPKLSAVSISTITRIACVLALLALSSMVISVLFPRPLPIIFAMSAGHALGGLAFLCYLAAVIVDAARARPSSAPPSETETQNLRRS